MIVTLEQAEIIEILAQALTKKTNYSVGTIEPSDCFFTVLDKAGDAIESFGEIHFNGRA